MQISVIHTHGSFMLFINGDKRFKKFIIYFVFHAEFIFQLKDREKQVVKDKFKSFNTDLEELVKTQQNWAVPDGGVKKEIRDMVKAKILPDYTDFRDK